jgi:hypothetical protein
VPGVVTQTRPSREQQAAQDAAQLIVFADGVEEVMPGLARKSRCAARDVLWLLDALASERSARQAMQAARDRAVEQLMQR